MSEEVPKKEEALTGEAEKEEKREEAKPQKVEKAVPKEEKNEKEKQGVHALYKIEGEKVTRLRPTCERCGPGYFMANHQDRYTCGHCGFTRYKQIEK
jgi:small subunit ribosomal protein S27Ae